MTTNKADKLHKSIIAELKRHRKEKGLSHEKLADLAGITRPAISFIESGKRNPSLLLCLKVCEAMGVDFSKVLKDSNSQL